MSGVVEVVPADAWVERATALRADGYTFCECLYAQDETVPGGNVRARVVLRVRHDGTWEPATIATDIADTLPSLQAVYPGVTWHEREAAEMFGLTLVAPDSMTVDARPLLLADALVAPLRKAVWLTARQETPWPGAADPGAGRRRHRPLGVPDEGRSR